jgi:probable F420-dependent oxidoreductase
MGQIRDLAEGREIDYRGTPVRLPWVRDGRLPIWMAGYGPKALALVGAAADGFVLQVADPDIARWTIGAVKAAATAAGRDPDSLSICVAAPAYVGTDVAHQRDQLRWFGGMVGNHVADLVARYGAASGEVPRQLTDYIAAREGYDYSHHGRAGNPSTDFVPDEIVDRFCLLGPVERHVERLAELRDIGATQFAVYLMHDAKRETLQEYGASVVGALSTAT